MIAGDGWRFIIPAWLLALLFFVSYLDTDSIWLLPLLVLAGLAAIFLTYFFRDPERTPPAGDNHIISPADGKVILIEDTEDKQGNPVKLVSIFMSIFDVHVNRIPISGKVVEVTHRPGKFYRAFMREAITENERTELVIQSNWGLVQFSQVAGILARRIVCNLRRNEDVTRGERFGMIRFGSRLDLFLGTDVKVLVGRGDRVRAGESVIGIFGSDG